MLILKHLDPSDTRAVRSYRLQVKERLYKFNYVSRSILRLHAFRPSLFWTGNLTVRITLQEVLAQMEKEERIEKLEETFQSVREGYQRILEMIG